MYRQSNGQNTSQASRETGPVPCLDGCCSETPTALFFEKMGGTQSRRQGTTSSSGTHSPLLSARAVRRADLEPGQLALLELAQGKDS